MDMNLIVTAILNLIECTASQVVAGDVLNLDGRMFPFVPDFTATVQMQPSNLSCLLYSTTQ